MARVSRGSVVLVPVGWIEQDGSRLPLDADAVIAAAVARRCAEFLSRPEATAAVARAVDLFAAEIGMDPADVRRKNLVPSFSEPRTTPSGATYDSGHGTATVLTGTSPRGQGHATTWAMLAGDQTGIPIEKITVLHGDTDRIPRGGGTMGSRSPLERASGA